MQSYPADLPPRFLNWYSAPDGTKLPCDLSGKVVDAHDPKHHVTYEAAAATGRGVAYALDDSSGWFFLDLDKCLTSEGAWSAEAVAIWQSFPGAWGEVSQSGRGLHIMGRCDPSQLQDRKHKWAGWLEFYTGGRFIAFGGRGWEPIGGVAVERDWTDLLRRWVPQREVLGALPEGIDPAYTGPEDDDDLLRLAMQSQSAAGAFGGVTFADLWEARVEPLRKRWPAYDGGAGFDHSSADAALMAHLAFWTGKDMPRMDRLFRRSGLMRDKYAARDDYRTDTVSNAARLCRKVYDVPRRETAMALHDTFLTIPEMKEFFAGCVYVRDVHRILIPDGSLLKPDQFNATYGGHIFQMMPDGGSKATPEAFKAFTQNAVHRFPMATTTTFRPDLPFGALTDDGVNIYVPVKVRMRPGDVSRFLDVIRKIVPNPVDFEILMSWAKWVVQNPGKKALWAPVLQGAEGNGKSMLAECIAYALGERNVHRARARDLGSTFNGWQLYKMLIIIEEVFMNGRREMLDDLKPSITNYRVPIREMQTTEATKYVPTNWFFTTNHKNAVVKSRADRRYAVFFCPQQTAEDVNRDFPGRFFPDYYDWLRNQGGFEMVAHWLHTDPPNPAYSPEFNPRAPNTSCTSEAITASMGPIEAEIVEAVDADLIGFRGGWISSFHMDHLLRTRGLRISRNSIAEIMATLGYVRAGRAPKPIFREENQRPVLWKKRDAEIVDYLVAQGPGYG